MVKNSVCKTGARDPSPANIDYDRSHIAPLNFIADWINMKYTEAEVQGLKAQDAKNYCIDLMHQMKAKELGPISPGEVQLKELEFELQLKAAETADSRLREEHLERIKTLELKIQEERAAVEQQTRAAEERQAEYASVIQQVADSQEKLSIQLDRATREHAVKIQIMKSEYESTSADLQRKIDSLQSEKDQLLEKISSLAEIEVNAIEIVQLKDKLVEKKSNLIREEKLLDEEIESAVYEKQKALIQIQREQEIELVELKTQHRKSLLDANQDTLNSLLAHLELESIRPNEFEKLKREASENRQLEEQEIHRIEHDAVADFKRKFNINFSETMDMTELFYREKATAEENQTLEATVKKLESDLSRAREHMEKESERVAKAIEAARTHIENKIESGAKG